MSVTPAMQKTAKAISHAGLSGQREGDREDRHQQDAQHGQDVGQAEHRSPVQPLPGPEIEGHSSTSFWQSSRHSYAIIRCHFIAGAAEGRSMNKCHEREYLRAHGAFLALLAALAACITSRQARAP